MSEGNLSGLNPIGYFVIVQLDSAERKTPGGIILPDTTVEKDEISAQEGTLVAISPHAFNYVENWPAGTKPEVGQRIMFKRYDGSKFERVVNGQTLKFKILNDQSLIAVVDAPIKLERAA